MVRFKNRYMVVEVRPSGSDGLRQVTQREVALAIKDSLETNFGDFGVGMAQPGLVVRCCDPTDPSITMVRCRCEAYKMARAAMTFVTGYREAVFTLNVLTVASTARTVRSPLLAQHSAAWSAAGVAGRDLQSRLAAVEEELSRF